MGCATATGRERVLKRLDLQTIHGVTTVSSAAVGGDYAGLIVTRQDPHYGGSVANVTVFDLRTGAAARSSAAKRWAAPTPAAAAAASTIPSIVDATDSASAVHTSVMQSGYDNLSTQTEEIVAGTATGIHILDSATSTSANAQPPPTVLSGLTPTGNTLSRQHAGGPQSTTLR